MWTNRYQVYLLVDMHDQWPVDTVITTAHDQHRSEIVSYYNKRVWVNMDNYTRIPVVLDAINYWYHRIKTRDRLVN